MIGRYINKKCNQEKERVYSEMVKLVNDSDINLRIEYFNGSFSMNFKSHIFKRLFLNGDYEKDLIAKVEKYIPSDKDIIDVGANIGLFTTLFAKKTDKTVFAAEPTDGAYSYLIKNIKTNNLNNVITFKGVIDEIEGDKYINFIDGNEEYSSLSEINHPSVSDKNKEKLKVQSMRIDDAVKLHNLNPGFIKIDVEGAEMNVLKSMIKTIKEFKPVIMCEVVDYMLENFNSSSKELFSLLNESGYEIIILDKHNRNSDKFIGNILAVAK
mgnify:CR=1 FL=1|jgi:FkbM family methyltransferase